MSGLCDRNREAVTAKIDLRLIGINERGKLFLIDCNDVQLFEKCLIGTGILKNLLQCFLFGF